MIKAASLFSSIGIGEYYLSEIDIDVIIANELSKSRSQTHEILYPNCKMINDDITVKEVQERIVYECKKADIKLIIATPPCQGLSSAGRNKTVPSLYTDPRNTLILSALNIVDSVKPDYFIIENVPRFQKMIFPYEHQMMSLQELLQSKYSGEYLIRCDIFNAADYGIPQTRMRVVYRMWKKNLKWDNPQKKPMVTLRDAIGGLPSIEAGEKSCLKNHSTRVHPQNHIECMRHTPSGKSAFKNEIHFPRKLDGNRIKGYGNSYKRMSWDMPAPTITMRNEIISSQENVHPGRKLAENIWSDARVLTLRELLIIFSLPEEMDIPYNLTETIFRHLIGEGIPPKLMKELMKGIVNNDSK